MNLPQFRSTGATIQDVAEKAGVSKKTVSRVINSEDYVTEKTARKVHDAIAALGYVPNVSAQRLASKRSYVLTLVYQAEEPPGWLAHVIRGVVQKAAEHGFEVVIHPSEVDEAASQQSLQALVMRGGTDGLILLPPFASNTEFNQHLFEGGMAMASIEPSNPDLPWLVATITNHQGALEMTEYLLGLGHQRIGFILGPEAYSGSWERLDGFNDALNAAGVAADEELIVSGDYTFESGLAQGRVLLAVEPRPTAIFASNDEMAAGVIQAAYEKNLRVPDDISVVGFDDSTLACRLSPPLTTIHQPTIELAAQVTEALIRTINDDTQADGDTRIEMTTSLVLRNSAARP
jgi:LacI family transcriptional regulator